MSNKYFTRGRDGFGDSFETLICGDFAIVAEVNVFAALPKSPGIVTDGHNRPWRREYHLLMMGPHGVLRCSHLVNALRQREIPRLD